MRSARLAGGTFALLALASVRMVSAQVPAEVRGRITDAATAHPIANARIVFTGRTESAQSGPDGDFVVRGLEPRDYTVHLRALGYLPRDIDIAVENGRTTRLDAALDPAPASLAAVLVRAARDSAPVSAVVFDRQAIESSGKRDVGELLQTTPGVVITRAGGVGAESRVSIRGSGANDVLVLMDGVPLNSAITGAADLSLVPLDLVDRVIVRTGAQSARYGSRAMAGVVEIETRHATNDASLLLRSGAWGERDASGTLGGTRPLGTLQASGTLTAGYRTLSGDFPYDVPAVRGGGVTRRVNSGATSRDVSGSVSLEGDSATASFRGAWQDSRRGMAGSIVQPSTTGRQDQARQSGGLDGRWHRGLVSARAAADVSHERATFGDPAPPFGIPFADTVDATSVTASSELGLGRGATTGSIGAETRDLGVGSNELAADAPHWQRLVGAWANGSTSRLIASSARLGLEAGARVDNSSLIAGTTVSPRAQASLSRGVMLASVSLASGYAPPTLADQFFQEGVLVRANPNLQPERTKHDLEARLAIHETRVGPLTLAADAAAYRADIDGMILWLPNFQFVWSPSNYAVHRSGWELSGRSTLPAAHVDFQAGLNRTDVVYAGSVLNGQVAYRPRTTGSITLGASRSLARLETTTRYVGARRTVPGSALNQLDPYWLTDIKLTSTLARVGWSTDIAVGIENLFDRPAAMLVDYPFPGRAWTVSLRLRRDRSADNP